MHKKIALCALSVFVGLAAAAYPQNEDTEETNAEAYEYEHPVEKVMEYFESIGAEYPLKDAYSDYEDGNFDKILFDADMVLSVFPADIEARFLKASAFLGKSDFKNAMVYYMPLYMQELDDRVPNMIWSIAGYSPAMVLELFEENLKKLGDDEDSKPLKKSMYECIGYCYSLLGQNRKAASEIYPVALMLAQGEDNLDEDEDNLENDIMSIANSWLKVGDGAEAYRILDFVSDSNGSHLKALALREQDKMPEAIALLKDAIKEYAYDYDLIMDLGIFLTATGRYDEAMDVFNTALDSIAGYDIDMYDEDSYASIFFKDKKAEMLLRRGIINQLKGNMDKANADFEAVVAMGETPFELNAKVRLGKIDEVEKLFQDENRFFRPIDIAGLYAAANLPEKAMPYLEKAFELQQITPTRLKYDINMMNMQKVPGYAEAVKKFDPSK